MREKDKLSMMHMTRNLTLPQKKQVLANLKKKVAELELDIELIERERKSHDGAA